MQPLGRVFAFLVLLGCFGDSTSGVARREIAPNSVRYAPDVDLVARFGAWSYSVARFSAWSYSSESLTTTVTATEDVTNSSFCFFAMDANDSVLGGGPVSVGTTRRGETRRAVIDLHRLSGVATILIRRGNCESGSPE